MQTVSLCDRLTVEAADGPGVRVSTNLSFLPDNEKNLAASAALRFWEATGYQPEGLRIAIKKEIPVCAGLAGGSSDAAAMLRLLNERYKAGMRPEELGKIGAGVGSDVPYCIAGGTALAEGRGERLTPLPEIPDCYFVLCKPPFPVSTPELFHSVDAVRLRCHPDTAGMIEALEHKDLPGIGQRLYNVFEDVLEGRKKSQVREIRHALLEQGALGTCMSGTGPTVFGLFSDGKQAQTAYRCLKEHYQETFLTKAVSRTQIK